MSSEDESDETYEKEVSEKKFEAPSTRQAKKVARLKQIKYQNEHKDKIRKVSKILKKKENEVTEEDREFLKESPEITDRLSKLKERRGTLKKRQLEIEDPLEELERKCRELANAIRHSNRVVVYTGAGISTAASIPDYRGPNGVWTLLQKGQQPKAQDLCDAKPTLTHMSIKKLQDEGHVTHVVSQNCDGLHMRSGLNRRKLSEVHGNMYIEICYSCRPHQEYIRLFDVTEKTGVRRHQTDRNCHTCREPLKDTIVHFGEKGGMKCPYRWKEAAKAADKCDIILCLGSSLKILKKYSCLWCMDRKVKDRPKLYIVNLQWTPRDDAATVKINGRCDEVMKRVMRDLGYEVPIYLEEEDPIFTLSTKLLKEEEETTTKKILEKPDISTKKERRQLRLELFNSINVDSVKKSKHENGCVNHTNKNSVKVEPVTVKSEPSVHVDMPTSAFSQPMTSHPVNHTINSHILHPNDAIRSVIDNRHTLDFSHLHKLLPAPSLSPSLYSLPPPLQLSPLLTQLPGFKNHVKFGEVSFPKYLCRGDNPILPMKTEHNSTSINVKDKTLESNHIMSQGAFQTTSSSQIMKYCSNNMEISCTKAEKSCGNRSIEGKDCTNKTTERSKPDSPRGRRARKSFCPNCHGVSGECPCMLLESSRKKKSAICKDCNQTSCICANSFCVNCKKFKCECQIIPRCHQCGLSQPSCKCGAIEFCQVCEQKKPVCKCSLVRPSVCQSCRHTPDKCTCVQNGHVVQCVVCKQHKSMCKCVFNHTSSVSQGDQVPKHSVPMPTGMPLLDYAKHPFPLNNFSPFYMPQVFQNFGMNGLLPGNNINPVLSNNLTMLPGNPTGSLLTINSPIPGTKLLSVEPILQDHSYLNKVQMQSLSPNCDISNQRSPNQGIKRSYSYIDDIPRAEDDLNIQNQNLDLESRTTVKDKPECQSISTDKNVSLYGEVESSSPIIIDDDEDEGTQQEESKDGETQQDESKDGDTQLDESTEEKQEKPKLMRSVSVPGWFGKGLNLKKRRR